MVVLVTAVTLLALAAAAYRFDLVEGWRTTPPPPDPTREPAAVPPPRGLVLPDPASPRPVVPALPGSSVDQPADQPAGETAGEPPGLDPGAVRRAVGKLPDARRLGPRVTVAVAGLDGRPAYRRGPRTVTPASTLKLLTSAAALSALGPEHRFTTRTVRSGGVVTLVGGGDPLLARQPAGDDADEVPDRADLRTLARATARALADQGRDRIRLAYDDSLFTGPRASPAWKADYLTDDVVSRITALWVDEGRVDPGLVPRSADPAQAAARLFVGALRDRGVRVTGPPTPGPAPGTAEPLAEVRSAELVEVVQHVLEVSDNEGAEVLARHVALARGRPASFGGGAAAVSAVVEDLGVPLGGAVLHDGSGLSRRNRLPVTTLLRLLATAADPAHPELAGVLEGLPVAGFSGSLAGRFLVRADAGLGYVRAKTGTLTGVHGLAGTTVGPDGSVLLFVAHADRVDVPDALFARARIDRIAAALTACRCAQR